MSEEIKHRPAMAGSDLTSGVRLARLADAIDLLEADVAAGKAKVEQRDAAIRERDAAIRERDEARAEAYRLKCSMTETSKERDAAIRERDEWKEEARLAVVNRDEARAEAQRIQDEADDQEQTEKVKRLNAKIEKLHCALLNRTWERDEARAEVERLKAERAAQATDGNRQATLDSSPAVTEPAAPAAGWLMDDERDVLEDLAFRIERWVNVDKYEADRKRLAALRSILARAGSPPVVMLPTVFARSLLGDELVALQQVKDSLDKVGVAWREVGRE